MEYTLFIDKNFVGFFDTLEAAQTKAAEWTQGVEIAIYQLVKTGAVKVTAAVTWE